MGEEETCRQALMMLTNFCMSDNFIHLLPSSREKWVCHAMGSSGNGGGVGGRVGQAGEDCHHAVETGEGAVRA